MAVSCDNVREETAAGGRAPAVISGSARRRRRSLTSCPTGVGDRPALELCAPCGAPALARTRERAPRREHRNLVRRPSDSG